MAAKRLGQALSNVEGTSKQILRVKTDESGFEFVEPATIPEYTITNSVTDRAMDANDTTLDELADVLGTLIADLEAAGLTGGSAGLEAFQWSTSEQVWPFEKDASGNTLYCKEIDFGALPNNGSKNVAHNITNFVLFKFENKARHAPSGTTIVLTFITQGSMPSGYLHTEINDTNIFVNSGRDATMYSGTYRLIYTKTT